MDEFPADDVFEFETPSSDWDTPVNEWERPATDWQGTADQAPPPPPPPPFEPGPDPVQASKEPPMYEPDDPPSAQWAPYNNTQAIPPQDDYAPQPDGVSAPPAGRTYGMYRQPPTWQHASLAGSDVASAASVVSSTLQGIAAIAGGAVLGYGLTQNPKAAIGGGLGMLGLLQIPTIARGEIVRSLVGIVAVVGAYFLLRDELTGFEGFLPNSDEDDDFEDDDDEDYEDDDGPDEPSGRPERSSPWMKDASQL